MSYTPSKPLAHYSGAKEPKLLLVGEAWGREEAEIARPFVGSSGKLLFEMLGEANAELEPELHREIVESHRFGNSWVFIRDQWFEAAQVGLTNVFNFQPLANKIESISFSKKELKERGLDKGYDWPHLKTGCYLDPQYLPELDRLIREIELLQPNLVVALGNTPCWALLRATAISNLRGAATYSNWSGQKVKVLPTYHPAAVLYQWSWRTIVVADLMKAFREAKFPEVRRPQRRVLVNPTIEEVEKYVHDLLEKALTGPTLEVGADCETVIGQVKMISFAPTKSEAIVIPFIDEGKPGRSYWPDAWTEERAWAQVKRLCECPAIRLVGQNFIYDMQYLCPMTIRFKLVPEDTMMLHHSLYPEMKKSLGFLGSVYTDEASWKLMRNQKADTEKRDE